MPAPDGEGGGACPDCGLGFSSVSSGIFTRQSGGDDDQPSEPDAARLRQYEDVLRGRSFPIYGLDDRWDGSRWVGGSGTSNGTINHIDLAHGDPFDEAAPLVRVTTWRLSPPEGLTVANAAHQLAESLWQEAGAPHDLVRSTFTSADPTESWSELHLAVDDHATTFRWLAYGAFWVALTRRENYMITVEARNISNEVAALVTVDDVERYLSGTPSPR